MSLAGLALARSTVDRDAVRRKDPELLATLAADPDTRVIVLDGDNALVARTANDPGTPVRLTRFDPQAAQHLVPLAEPLAYLGRDSDGSDYLAYARLGVAARPTPGATPAGSDLPAPEGHRWATLREVGVLLDDTDAGLFTTAQALVHWHAVHPRCSRCGEPTAIAEAGWMRRCPSCGGEHFPRTDPAVIMTVVDDEDRVLMGRQQSWPPGRYSVLAGFVEPGESIESTVRREVMEEAGVLVGEVAYLGSQPWPFPCSLMLGFTAQALSTTVRVDGDELAHARWWSREQLAADIVSGEVIMPPGLSISIRLVEAWYGGPLPVRPDTTF
jgi:NAD+ diphosphatase